MTTLAEAVVALRDCVELCCLLDNRRDAIKHSYLHRAGLVHHLVLRVLPLPLPIGHPQRSTLCFWASQPMSCYLQVRAPTTTTTRVFDRDRPSDATIAWPARSRRRCRTPLGRDAKERAERGLRASQKGGSRGTLLGQSGKG